MSDLVYFHRELLTSSLEDRNVELITISGHNEKSEDREEPIKNLFPVISSPKKGGGKNRFSNERSHKFGRKKCVFLSARVHPGEV